MSTPTQPQQPTNIDKAQPTGAVPAAPQYAPQPPAYAPVPASQSGCYPAPNLYGQQPPAYYGQPQPMYVMQAPAAPSAAASSSSSATVVVNGGRSYYRRQSFMVHMVLLFTTCGIGNVFYAASVNRHNRSLR